jgi:glycosyltransferase involved in cell wall biosynthesis/SAM-dependent methyltransferase
MPETATISPLVSVIIPCYNHGRHLAAAIDSVLKQDHQPVELIVVDDGSTDNSRAVATGFPGVVYVYQQNQGLSAARNTGITHSKGAYLVFLDADDKLVPGALRTNLQLLQQHTQAGFVSGAHLKLNERNELIEEVKTTVEQNHYQQLLQGNYIGMHATVMYPRWVFNRFRYDTGLKACEDYDLYLRIAREHPVLHHTALIALYYIHGSNMSGNIPLMLNTVLEVLQRQQSLLRSETEKKCLQTGIQVWKQYYTEKLWEQLLSGLPFTAAASRKEAVHYLWLHNKQLFFSYQKIRWLMGLKQFVRKHMPVPVLRWLHKAGRYRNFIPPPGKIKMGDFNRTRPYSKEFGYDRGGPVDRYYIENFLQQQSSFIHGRVLEIGDNEYTLRFGGSRVTQSDILHVDANNAKATFIGDLTHAPQIPDNSFDCIVLTQTLHLIYDYRKALETCYRILKPGGRLLLTVPGISHIDYGEWGDNWLWSFTKNAVTKVLAEVFPPAQTTVTCFGNVLVATAFLYGIGLPELKKEQMDEHDEHYQVIITATATKPESN